MKKGKTRTEQYDLLVIGSGEGGKFLAWTMAKKGQRAAVIERKYIGGSCPNIACLPSKNIIHSAKVANYFWRGEEFGVSKENCQIHMPLVRDRKRKMVEGLVQMHLDNFKASRAELILGTAQFTGPKTLEVALNEGGTRALTAENVVINTGSRATIDATPIMTPSIVKNERTLFDSMARSADMKCSPNSAAVRYAEPRVICG